MIKMKKFIKKMLLLCIILLCNCNVYAVPNTYDRDLLENYGVNKKWKITDKNKSNVLNTPKVDAEEKIYDFSDILTEEEEESLLEKINNFREKTNMEIVILTASVPYQVDETNETYATDFYDYNDFGLDLENYDGIIFFRNTYVSDPYYAMYMFGEAQLYYASGRYDQILDSIYYNIRNGYYYDALNYFIDECDNYYDAGIPSSMSNAYIDDMGFIRYKFVPPFFTAFLISCFATLIIMLILIKKNKMVKKATLASEYLNNNSILYSRSDDTFISAHTSSHTSSSGSGGHGGGHSSRGSSGGGHSGGGRHG